MNDSPRTVQDILDHADELAERCEAFDPEQAIEIPVDDYLRDRAARASAAQDD